MGPVVLYRDGAAVMRAADAVGECSLPSLACPTEEGQRVFYANEFTLP
jgi:hypothetical protein